MKCFFLFLSLATSSLLYAQETFLVYSVKGNVTVSENNVSGKAKIGNLLSTNAKVNLPQHAVVTFICNQTGLVTIDKAGTHSLSDYKNQCNNKSTSVSSNYLKYVWTQLTQKPGTPEKNRKQFMNNVGAVSRNINNVWIDPRLDSFYYVSGNFPLSWKSYAEADEFELMVFDKVKDITPLFTVSTKQQSLNIDDISKQLEKGKPYYWTAAIKGQQNDDRKLIRVLDKKDLHAIVSGFAAPDAAFENESARLFRQAFLLEQAHFLADAYSYYKKAAELQPDVEMYVTTLKAFKKDYQIQ